MSQNTSVLIFAETNVPADLRVQLAALHGATTQAHDTALRPVSMLLVRDGKVLASLELLSKLIMRRGTKYSLSGLSRVLTDAQERGCGHGTRLVKAARETIATSGFDLGIFTCDRPLQEFYERCGWQVLQAAVLIGGTPERPFPSDQFDKVTLGAFFTERAQRHRQSFEHCRIGLYPGEIDRLW